MRKAFEVFQVENLTKKGHKVNLANITHRFEIFALALKPFWNDWEEDRRNGLKDQEGESLDDEYPM